MAKTLELFKRAGLEDILSPALIGAGAGGLGMGAASFLNNDDEEASFGDKLKSSLGSGLKGALLGGAAGAGYGGIKEMFGNATAPNPAIQDIVNSTPRQLDTNAHGVNHPIEAQIGNLTSASPPWLTALMGGGAGMGIMKSMRNAGRAVGDAATVLGGGDGKKAPRFDLNNAADSLKNARGVIGTQKGSDRIMSKLTNMFKGTNTAHISSVEHLAKQDLGKLPYTHQQGTGPHMPDRLEGVRSLLQRDGYGGGDHTKQLGAARKILGNIDNPIMSRVKRYGGAGAVGAGTAVGAQIGLDKLFDVYLNGKYPQEQLKLWNEVANQNR